MILEKGRPAVTAVLMNVKAQLKSYVIQYAQLSPVERDLIMAKDPAYQMVADLLQKEAKYLKDLEF